MKALNYWRFHLTNAASVRAHRRRTNVLADLMDYLAAWNKVPILRWSSIPPKPEESLLPNHYFNLRVVFSLNFSPFGGATRPVLFNYQSRLGFFSITFCLRCSNKFLTCLFLEILNSRAMTLIVLFFFFFLSNCRRRLKLINSSVSVFVPLDVE